MTARTAREAAVDTFQTKKLKNNPMHSRRAQLYQWLDRRSWVSADFTNRFDSSGKTPA
jgi:hypothetical protein